MSDTFDDLEAIHLTEFSAFYDSLAANSRGETVVKFRVPRESVEATLALLGHPGELMSIIVHRYDFEDGT